MKKSTILKLAAVMATFTLILIALQASSSSMAAGQSANAASLYGSKCALCHAKNGAGLPTWRSKGQPDFTNSDWQKSHTDAQIAEAIRSGKGKNMPTFKGKLTEEQVTALVGIVRGFGKK